MEAPVRNPLVRGRQRRGGYVVGGADAPGRIGRGPGAEQRGLSFVAQGVVRAGVDGSGRDGIDT